VAGATDAPRRGARRRPRPLAPGGNDRLDPVRAPICTHAARQVADGPLGRGVGRDGWARELALHRGDIDDLATPPRNHPSRHGLAHEERTGDIRFEQLTPAFDGEILERRPELHPGIVDQDVDRADFGLDLLDRAFRRHLLGHVEGETGGARNRGSSSFELGAVAPVQHDSCAVFGQPLRQRKADALARAGDQCKAPTEVKKRCGQATLPSDA